MRPRTEMRIPLAGLSPYLALLVVGSAFVPDGILSGGQPSVLETRVPSMEKQITHGPGGRILANIGVWSPDGQWVVYDTRSDAAGERFDGRTIERVNVDSGKIEVLYRSRNGAFCGVPIYHPRLPQVAFIHGPENPTPDWQYNAWHRQGVIVQADVPHTLSPLDARDLTPPFTPGALRGGSHVHVWDPSGELVSFTYEDHVLAQFLSATSENDVNARNLGVASPGRVRVSTDHPRNHDGDYFSVLVTRTTPVPEPGSDQITKAFEEGWVGTNGYVRQDGSRQPHALAFQGLVADRQGKSVPEVFIVDLPADLTVPAAEPLEGTARRMPAPPKGTLQRRLTRTLDRKFPGVSGPRHWLRSSPDGSKIAFLMKDDDGIGQLWTVSPAGESLVQVTRNPHPIASAFSWSSDGELIAHAMDGSVCVTQVMTGKTTRLSPAGESTSAPRQEACVFSPDGSRIAYVKRLPEGAEQYNQIFTVAVKR
jgi:hypothetical protein